MRWSCHAFVFIYGASSIWSDWVCTSLSWALAIIIAVPEIAGHWYMVWGRCCPGNAD